MNGINKVILLGTLGNDPQAYTSRDGKSYSALSIATNKKWKSQTGSTEEKTDWHRVTVWGKQGELCRKYLSKGSRVYVEGTLATSESEEDGKKSWRTFIRAEDVTFLSARKESQTISPD